MKTISTGLAVVSLFLAVGGSGCGSSPSTSGPLSATALGAKYKFSPTDIAGWQLDPNDPTSFQVLDESTPNNLIRFMDGGADAYTNAGCRVTVYQSLVGPNGEIAGNFFSMDFVSDAQATAMFNSKKSDYSASDPIAGFDGSVAIGHSVFIGGSLSMVNVFAHFKAMYFELTLSGFADQASFYQGAAQLVNVAKSKTN
jgi:hypothetical protein